MSENRDIWFPAKTYGVGWGLPITWQGWAVILLYLLLLIFGGAALSISPFMVPAFVIYVLVLTGLLFYICYKKGATIDFRWGKKEKPTDIG